MYFVGRNYLNLQDKKEYNFSSKEGNPIHALIPVNTNVFSYLLLGKLTQLQSKTVVNISNNEYFLAKSLNIQKDKNINIKRLGVFINSNNIKNSTAVNYKRIGFNKFSIYNIFSSLKKDRFFLNDKFYQDILGKRAFTVYKDGMFGYERSLKMFKKYNEYFERQVYLMTRQYKDYAYRYHPAMAIGAGSGAVGYWAQNIAFWDNNKTTNTSGRVFMDIWRKVDESVPIAEYKNQFLDQSGNIDEKHILNVEDLGLLTLKNLRDYEMYFGLQFYGKEVGRYLSKLSMGRTLTLNVFSRNATRFNFLKDLAYGRVSSNARMSAKNKYGLLKSLFTKKHFPKNSLEVETGYPAFSVFNVENINVESNKAKIISHFKNNRKVQTKTIKLTTLRKNKRIQVRLLKSIKINKFYLEVKKLKNLKYSKINSSKQKLSDLCITRRLVLCKYNNKKQKIRFYRLSFSNKKIKKGNNKSRVLVNLTIKLNNSQLRSLIVTTLFSSLNRESFRTATNRTRASMFNNNSVYENFETERERFVKKVNTTYDPFMLETLTEYPVGYLAKTNLFRLNPGEPITPGEDFIISEKGVKSQNVKSLRGVRMFINSMRYVQKQKKYVKKLTLGILNYKYYQVKRERLVLTKLMNTANVSNSRLKDTTITTDSEQLKDVYKGLGVKDISLNRFSVKNKYKIVFEDFFKVNKVVKAYSMNKVSVFMDSVNFINSVIYPKNLNDNFTVDCVKSLKLFHVADYRQYRLQTMFELGLTDRINTKTGVAKKEKRRILRGTIAGRRGLAAMIGAWSNEKVGGITAKAYKNKIGLNSVFLYLGIKYKNSKKLKLFGGKESSLLSKGYIFKKIINNKLKTLNFNKYILRDFSIKNKAKENSVMLSDSFFINQKNMDINAIKEYRLKSKLKRLALVKSYLGLVNIPNFKDSVYLVNDKFKPYYGINDKIDVNFLENTNILQEESLKGFMRPMQGVYTKGSLKKKINIESIKKNLNIKENLEILDLSLRSKNETMLEKYEHVMSCNDFYLDYNNKKHSLKTFSKLRSQENLEFNYINPISGEVCNSFKYLSLESRKKTKILDNNKKLDYNWVDTILTKKFKTIPNMFNSKKGSQFWELAEVMSKKLALEKNPYLNYSVFIEWLGMMSAVTFRESNTNYEAFGLSDHCLSNILANTMKRLGKYSWKINGSYLRPKNSGRQNFLKQKSHRNIWRNLRRKGRFGWRFWR